MVLSMITSKVATAGGAFRVVFKHTVSRQLSSLLSLSSSTSRCVSKVIISHDNLLRFFKYSQDTPKHTVRDELANHTWQFDAATVAKMLSPKTRKSPFDPHDIDTLDDYDIPKIDADVLKQAADSLKSTPKALLTSLCLSQPLRAGLSPGSQPRGRIL